MESVEDRDDGLEAVRLSAALHDPAGWPRPPAGFALRCLERIASGDGSCRSPRRWLKDNLLILATVYAFGVVFGHFAGYLF